MTRSFYKLAAGIIVLLVLLSLWFAIQLFQHGEVVFDAPWYMYVFWAGVILEFMALMMEFKYYKFKDYTLAWRLTFFATARWIAVSIIVFTSVKGREYGMLDYVVVTAGSLVAIAEGIILVYSRANERIWLKRLGIVLLIFIPIVLPTYLILVTTSNTGLQATLYEAFGWIEIIGSMIPIFYVLNYLDELKQLPSETPVLS